MASAHIAGAVFTVLSKVSSKRLGGFPNNEQKVSSRIHGFPGPGVLGARVCVPGRQGQRFPDFHGFHHNVPWPGVGWKPVWAGGGGSPPDLPEKCVNTFLKRFSR